MFISTVTFLQHVPRYIYDFLISDNCYMPEKVVFNKTRFSKQFVYELSRAFRYNENIAQVKLVSLFDTEIDTFFHDEHIKEFVIRFKLFYLLMLFLAETPEDIHQTLMSDDFPFPFEVKKVIDMFMDEQIALYTTKYRDGSDDVKGRIASQVMLIFQHLFDGITAMYRQSVYNMFSSVLQPTCTIAEVIRRRLQILGLFNNYKEIIHFIQSTTVPSSYAIRNANVNRKMNPYVLKEFKLYFPKDVKDYHSSQLVEFENFIWKTHLYKSPMMQKKLKGQEVSNINPSFTPAEILLQIFVFSLENWQDVWKVNFPCSFEIVQRLNILKFMDNWTPDAKDITLALLAN